MIALALAAANLSAAKPAPVQTRIENYKTYNSVCIVLLSDNEGDLTVIIDWSPCEDLKLRIMTTAQLRELDQLEGSAKYLAELADRKRNGEVLTVWGELTAAFYFRDTGPFTQEVFIAD